MHSPAGFHLLRASDSEDCLPRASSVRLSLTLSDGLRPNTDINAFRPDNDTSAYREASVDCPIYAYRKSPMNLDSPASWCLLKRRTSSNKL